MRDLLFSAVLAFELSQTGKKEFSLKLYRLKIAPPFRAFQKYSFDYISNRACTEYYVKFLQEIK